MPLKKTKAMKSVKGTKTEKNLLTSFAGESQARNRYTYFASVAKKEGYEQIAAIFEETANQEKEHAKRMFKYLEGGMVEITASYPAGVIGSTADNLRAAAAGENEEWSKDYPHFAQVAREEGFPDIAAMYENICVAEKGHEERYLAFLKILKKVRLSRKQAKLHGNVATVDLFTRAKLHLKYAPHACIHKATLR